MILQNGRDAQCYHFGAMRVAITGAAGLFGAGLTEWFEQAHDVVALTRADADITDRAAIQRAIAAAQPEAVIHPAGIPDIDRCEQNPALARAVNVEGTRNVVEAARATGATLVFISTDAVFDGAKRAPYTEEDQANPPSVYGHTKVEAEQIVRGYERHLIFRVPLLFGPGKTNFVEKALRALAAGEPCSGATDQFGGALYTLDGAAAIERALLPDARGVFHLANTGQCSRYEVACKAAELAGYDPARVIPRTLAELRRPGPRVPYAVMEMRALDGTGISRPRPWQEALAAYVQSLRGTIRGAAAW
jgi:dTDP-4-dehydrorhamnose reductase